MTKRTYLFEVETPNIDTDNIEILKGILPYKKTKYTKLVFYT